MHTQGHSLPPNQNCLNNLQPINKQQECSSKAKDGFVPVGFLCFANKLLNEPTRLTTSNLSFKYSIYSWQQLSYVLKELLLQQVLVPVVIQKSSSLKCCHGMIIVFSKTCISFKMPTFRWNSEGFNYYSYQAGLAKTLTEKLFYTPNQFFSPASLKSSLLILAVGF